MFIENETLGTFPFSFKWRQWTYSKVRDQWDLAFFFIQYFELSVTKNQLEAAEAILASVYVGNDKRMGTKRGQQLHTHSICVCWAPRLTEPYRRHCAPLRVLLFPLGAALGRPNINKEGESKRRRRIEKGRG